MRPNLFIWGLLITTIFVFISCENLLNSNSNKDNPYVTKFNVEEMARQYLVAFTMLRKRPMWNYGREYVFTRESDKAAIYIIVGLHPSVREVEDCVLDLLNSISMRMKEGSMMGEAIGDNVWWYSPSYAPDKVTDILFIRKNAFISLNSDSNIDLIVLAKAIDEDIMKGASYITIKNSISLPVINSISLSKSELKEGESAKITINATDPEGGSLEYIFHGVGLGRTEGDPENVVTLIASRDYVPEPFFGTHIIQFCVINKNNVVSRVSEIKINIIQ